MDNEWRILIGIKKKWNCNFKYTYICLQWLTLQYNLLWKYDTHLHTMSKHFGFYQKRFFDIFFLFKDKVNLYYLKLEIIWLFFFWERERGRKRTFQYTVFVNISPNKLSVRGTVFANLCIISWFSLIEYNFFSLFFNILDQLCYIWWGLAKAY